MLRVRPFIREDAKEIAFWTKDENTFYKWSAGLLGTFPISPSDLADHMIRQRNENQFFPFTAFDEEGIAGFFILRRPKEDDALLRLGFIILSPEKRGKGYGKEMLGLAKVFAFGVYRAERLTLGVFENNPPAIYCYRASGFSENGEESIFPIKDTGWKCIDMEITKKKYEEMEYGIS